MVKETARENGESDLDGGDLGIGYYDDGNFDRDLDGVQGSDSRAKAVAVELPEKKFNELDAQADAFLAAMSDSGFSSDRAMK